MVNKLPVWSVLNFWIWYFWHYFVNAVKIILTSNFEHFLTFLVSGLNHLTLQFNLQSFSYRILFIYRVQWINYYICTNELYPFLLSWFKQRIDRDKVLVTKSSRTLVLISPQIGLWWQCFGVFISACLIHGLDFFRLMLSCRISVCNCLLQMEEKNSWINLYFSKSIVHLEVWRSFFSFFLINLSTK